jgi:hypothetical protein
VERETTEAEAGEKAAMVGGALGESAAVSVEDDICAAGCAVQGVSARC